MEGQIPITTAATRTKGGLPEIFFTSPFNSDVFFVTDFILWREHRVQRNSTVIL